MPKTESIVLGAGCFWCTEATMSRLRGVISVVPGYAGGTTPHPTYAQVCTGKTGHAEVARVTFDPAVISLEQILTVFFTIHDPTTLNRQGADVGTQYRSIILYEKDAQRATATKLIAKLTHDQVFTDPIVTGVEPLGEFYKAKDEHVDYYRKHPESAYCQAVISPKIGHLRAQFASLLI